MILALLFLPTPVYLILADQVPSAPDSPTSWITSGGIVGLLCFTIVAFLREWIVVGSIHRREIASRDQELTDLKADRAEMTTFLRDQVMPALTRSNDFASTLAEQQALQDRERILEERKRRT